MSFVELKMNSDIYFKQAFNCVHCCTWRAMFNKMTWTVSAIILNCFWPVSFIRRAFLSFHSKMCALFKSIHFRANSGCIHFKICGNVLVCSSFQCNRRFYHLNFTESLTTQSGRIFYFGISFRVKKQTFIKLASHPKRIDVNKMRYRKKITHTHKKPCTQCTLYKE